MFQNSLRRVSEAFQSKKAHADLLHLQKNKGTQKQHVCNFSNIQSIINTLVSMAKHDLLQIKVLLNCRYVSVCYRYEYKGKVCHFCVLCILMHPARVHSVFCYCFSYCVTVCTHRTCSSFIILVWTSSSNIESLCFQLIILSLFTHNPMEQHVTAALPYNVSSWWTLLSQNNVVSGFENTLRKHLDSPISCHTCYTYTYVTSTLVTHVTFTLSPLIMFRVPGWPLVPLCCFSVCICSRFVSHLFK